MKYFLSTLTLLISTQAIASEHCKAVWNIESAGIFLGESKDSLTINNSGIKVSSVLTPASLLSFLGVNSFSRIVNFNNDHKITYRLEEKNGSKPEKIVWKQKNNLTWEKFYNSEDPIEFELPQKRQIIDSTTLPYLAKLGLLDLNKKESDVIVLTKGNPYEANIYVENISEQEKVFKVSFKNDRNNGIVYLDAEKNPVEIFFADKKNSFKGYLMNFNCSKS